MCTLSTLVADAQKLIARIDSRRLYTFAGETSLPSNEHNQQLWKLKPDEIIQSIIMGSGKQAQDRAQNTTEAPHSSMSEDEDIFCSQVANSSSVPSNDLPKARNDNSAISTLCAADILVEKGSIHFGQKEKNPVDQMRFYYKDDSKSRKWHAHQVDERKYENLLPRNFMKRTIRLFVREAHKRPEAVQAFNSWCKNEGLETPIGMRLDDLHVE